MTKNAKQWILGLFGIFFMSNSYGACTSAQGLNCLIEVKATVINGCVIDHNTVHETWGVLDFGSYTTADSGIKSTVLVQNSVIEMKCTPGTELVMSIDGGENSQGNNRRMRFSDKYIDYRLYTDNLKSTELSIGAEAPVTLTSDGKIQLAMYSEANLEQDMPAGVYKDKVVITISY